MRSSIGFALVTGLALSAVGCEVVIDLFRPTTVTVSLVNESSLYSVDATLFYDDEDDIPRLLLPETGTERSFTILPGAVATFVKSCDDLQALMIEDADLRVLGDVGPETNTDVLRIDDDFECGDELVFTFTHSDAILDFDVSVTAIPFTAGE